MSQRFGGKATKDNTKSATGFTVNSDSLITATVPTGAETVQITVTTAGGTTTSIGTFVVN